MIVKCQERRARLALLALAGIVSIPATFALSCNGRLQFRATTSVVGDGSADGPGVSGTGGAAGTGTGAAAGIGGAAGTGGAAGIGAAAGMGGSSSVDAGGAAGIGGAAGAHPIPNATCTSDADCLPGLRCDAAGSRACVGCLANADCQRLSGFPACDPTFHRCIRCTTATDCGANQACISRLCFQTCSVDTQCSSNKCESEMGGVCSACEAGDRGCPSTSAAICIAPGYCVACQAQADCAAVGPNLFCETASYRCLACTSDSSCAAPTPLCDLTLGQCVATP